VREDWREKSKPISPGGVYPAKDQCSRCGLCDTYYIAHVKDACAFLGDGMSRVEVITSIFLPIAIDIDMNVCAIHGHIIQRFFAGFGTDSPWQGQEG
jgi:hypothetical protein